MITLLRLAIRNWRRRRRERAERHEVLHGEALMRRIRERLTTHDCGYCGNECRCGAFEEACCSGCGECAIDLVEEQQPYFGRD